VESSCECGNEPSRFMFKVHEYLHKWRSLSSAQLHIVSLVTVVGKYVPSNSGT
jgi:hypothetical protein